ncbi:MAG: glutamine--tRNA ligase/YqeY domain fusion protein [Proteobacteria bacterium]|nr:glutamine--tRNA ligase/YqeY domain fusion protein [Pseudomonadota bacterium]
MDDSSNQDTISRDFIRNRIAEEIETGKCRKVITRFPPEPNGFLHIGHAKSICLNFGIAAEFGGDCHLRFDDTNPSKESKVYVDSIIEDLKWLGFYDAGKTYYASDYFQQFYEYALRLIRNGKAYVCSLSPEEMREYRGTLTAPGKESPYRTRSVEENLDLFEKMKSGGFPDGAHVLRAKIDMSSPNLNMRDPVLYRIQHTSHHRTGDKWCIYPMYDYAHCLEDAIEGVTHSICTLEFEDHRPLYDWVLDEVGTACHPQQIEFARLNLGYTVMSKRKLLELVEGGDVNGWDDSRMPTISGMRSRGYTPASIRAFCKRIGVSKKESRIDMLMLEEAVRDDLNENAPRVMAVLNPLRVVIENYPEERLPDEFDAPNHPAKPEMGTRKVPFSKVIYIEREDFMEDPPKKFFRLGPGREVRLRYAYFIKCESVEYEDSGEIKELRCTYDPETRGGSAPDGRKVKGTLHWVSEKHAVKAEVRIYDRLFNKENPDGGKEAGDFKDSLNPESLTSLEDCLLEPSVENAAPGKRYQFERQGYFCLDVERSQGRPVFNRTATLRDSWAKAKS